jgi:hypothetical protein
LGRDMRSKVLCFHHLVFHFLMSMFRVGIGLERALIHVYLKTEGFGKIGFGGVS